MPSFEYGNPVLTIGFTYFFNHSSIRYIVLTHSSNYQLDWQLQLSQLENLREPLQ